MKFLSYFVLFSLCFLMSGCQKKLHTSQKTIPTFNYPAMPEYGIEAHVCSEHIHPMFVNLGIECLCTGSDGAIDPGRYYYSRPSKKSGYTTECKSVSEWRQDLIQAKQSTAREEADKEAKKMAEKIAIKQEWERNRPIREAEARRRNEQLNKICSIYYIARQSCSSAGGFADNYEKCMNIRLNYNYQNSLDLECFAR
jgi:hypothetical protein